MPTSSVAPKDSIAEEDNLEHVHQRAVVDEAEKRLHWKKCTKRTYLGAGKNPGRDVFGYEQGVGQTDVSNRQNESDTMSSGTGAAPLALGTIESRGWHQLCWCCRERSNCFREENI